jgi:DNA-directed RNA polymerase subunit RPC12/RpoP
MEDKIKCPKCGWGSTVRYLRKKDVYYCFHCGTEFSKKEKDVGK